MQSNATQCKAIQCNAMQGKPRQNHFRVKPMIGPNAAFEPPPALYATRTPCLSRADVTLCAIELQSRTRRRWGWCLFPSFFWFYVGGWASSREGVEYVMQTTNGWLDAPPRRSKKIVSSGETCAQPTLRAVSQWVDVYAARGKRRQCV